MKRILCLLCILALSAGLFAACGKSDPPPNPYEQPTTAAQVDPPQYTDPTENGIEINNFEELGEALEQLGQMFSASWPENQYTKQVPKPKFDVSLGTLTDDGYVALSGASIAELKEYVKELQKAGFTKNAETTDTSAFGITVYSYSANNGKGTYVEIGNAMGMSTISISKVMG